MLNLLLELLLEIMFVALDSGFENAHRLGLGGTSAVTRSLLGAPNVGRAETSRFSYEGLSSMRVP
jgi:hypothetical protein